MTSISAGHIILTPTQPVGSGRPQRGSNPGPPDQKSRVLPTELPHPPEEKMTEEIKREVYRGEVGFKREIERPRDQEEKSVKVINKRIHKEHH